MDIQKTMDFILERQAALTVSGEDTDRRIKALATIAEQHESDLQTHTEWLKELSKASRDLLDATVKLKDEHVETRENLNILVRTVQDMLRNQS
jgi:hypothetical protein